MVRKVRQANSQIRGSANHYSFTFRALKPNSSRHNILIFLIAMTLCLKVKVELGSSWRQMRKRKGRYLDEWSGQTPHTR